MVSKLGLHWLRYHPDGRDMAHIEAMQYKSVKTFEWMHGDRNFCNDLLAALPQDSYILARNHPRSEQKEDVWRDPVGAGIRHADEWMRDLSEGRCFLPTDRTFFLPVNEPDATTGDRNAIDLYTSSFLDRLREHGLRGGAFNFSTGHPRTEDGTSNTPADYSVFERSHQSIVRGHHIGVLHIYGTAATPCAPGHFDRLKACAWHDVEWVVGECGADEHVIGGGNHDGYLISMNGHINDYCPWLDNLILGVNDSRIHSYQVFTYDFSHPWDSFDTRPIRDALESYQWRHMQQQPPEPPDPIDPTPPSGALVWPVQGPITQYYGAHGIDYPGEPGHDGIDYAVAEGTPVVAPADGIVKWVDNDPNGFGLYIRTFHPQHGFHSFVAHLSQQLVRPGQRVTKGQTIALSGNTGRSSGPHLHYSTRLGEEDAYYELHDGYQQGATNPLAVYALINGTDPNLSL